MNGVKYFTLPERGAYISLLCEQWDAGAISDRPQDLAKLFGCSKREAEKVWAKVGSKFDKGDDGLYRNARLERERCKQQRFRDQQAERGKQGGRPKKAAGLPGESAGLIPANPDESGPWKSPSSSSSSLSSSSDPENHLDPVSAGSQSPPPRAPAPLIPAGQSARWGVIHGDHLSQFCDWKCFPVELANQFAAQLVGSRHIPHIEALRDVTLWAQSVRDSGVIPTGKMFDFWNGQWEATHGSCKPVTDGAAGRAARTAQRLNRFVEHG